MSCELPEFSSLEFRDVTFAYPGTKRKVLDHLSFQISAGKSYSFVGANGCGKTTITKLIVGLYDDYEGQILINGTDIREWGPGRIAGFSLLSIRILPDMDFRSMRILPSGMWKNCAETKSIWFVFKMLSI